MPEMNELRGQILEAGSRHGNSAAAIKTRATTAEAHAAERLVDLISGAGRDLKNTKGVRLSITAPTQNDVGDVTRQIVAQRADGTDLQIEWRYLAASNKFTASPLDSDAITYLTQRRHTGDPDTKTITVNDQIAIDLIEAIGGQIVRFFNRPIHPTLPDTDSGTN